MTREQIDAICPGWSGQVQWDFFHEVAKRLPDNTNILILGVYMGRDIGYLAQAMRTEGKMFAITGVDKFNDDPGADWLPETRGMTWQQAHGVDAPSLLRALKNIQETGYDAYLIQEDAIRFLPDFSELIGGRPLGADFIYIDLSHDYETTRKAIEGAIMILKPGGILAGDDYTNANGWGVKRAVDQKFSRVTIHGNTIWEVTP